jgi:membrane-associated phospholipid phosphatase
MSVVVLATKYALGRSLPYTRPGHQAQAFPSGHTATFLVCLGTLALLAAVAVGTLLVAASLVYDGFHWLTDTLASMSLGVAVLSLLRQWISRRTASRRSAADTPPTGRTAHPH